MKITIGSHIAEVDLAFADLVKVDDNSAELDPYSDDLSHPTPPVIDPIGSFIVQKTAAPELTESTKSDFDILKVLASPGDFRDEQPPITVLRKDATVPDWSWSSPISADAPFSKRATPTAERFCQQLKEFFKGHDEELAEAIDIVSEAIAEEKAAILAEA